MIVKEKRDRSKLGFERYNLRLIDKFDNSFVMLVGDNGDLYWLPEDYKRVKEFYIDKDDAFLFDVFNQLFNAIVKRDNDKYNINKTVEGNTFTFISEDCHVDEAHRLQIVREDEQFVIKFLRNPNEHLYTFPKRGCNICFCNSGSRIPKIEQLFMLLFNELAYYNDQVELVK